jgi:hypothetical protein
MDGTRRRTYLFAAAKAADISLIVAHSLRY